MCIKKHTGGVGADPAPARPVPTSSGLTQEGGGTSQVRPAGTVHRSTVVRGEHPSHQNKTRQNPKPFPLKP
jgi:hypothetical protein